jgi:dolichyl-phosphate beta-glucosyltransferase
MAEMPSSEPQPPPKLSVIIPAFNEEVRLPATLTDIAGYFDTLIGRNYEILVVDDGSTDRTHAIVDEMSMKHPAVRYAGYSQNRGKGYAVRHGMLQAKGEWRLFCDADMATPIEEYELLYESLLPAHAEVAIGSRPLRESNLIVHQPWYREALGRAFNKVVQLLAVPGVQDTQCGFKIFSEQAARDIFTQCRLDGFAFDAEALYLARRMGYHIVEVPIRWSHKSGSKVSMLRDGTRMIFDLLRIRGMHLGVKANVTARTA